MSFIWYDTEQADSVCLWTKGKNIFSWAPLYELLSAAFLPLVAALAAYTSCIFSIFSVLVYCSAHSEVSTITIQMPITTVLRGESDTSFAHCCCPQGAVLPSVGQVPALPYCLHQKIGDASLCSQEQVHLLRNEPAELILIAISLWARIQPGIGHGITCDSLDLCGREDLFFILLLSLRLSSNGCFWRRFLPHAVFISFSFQQKDISSTAPCLHNTNK